MEDPVNVALVDVGGRTYRVQGGSLVQRREQPHSQYVARADKRAGSAVTAIAAPSQRPADAIRSGSAPAGKAS